MKQSRVYHVMVRPRTILGIDRSFAFFGAMVSLSVGGLGCNLYFGNGLYGLAGCAVLLAFFWIVGLVKSKNDPEFFSVLCRNVFKIGKYMCVDGKRNFEP